MKTVELVGEPGGFHAEAAVVESSPTGIDPGLQFLEVVLQVAEHRLFAAVSYDLSICCPVG